MATVVVRYEANNREMRLHMMGREVQAAALAAAVDVTVEARRIAERSDPADKGSGDGSRYVDHFSVQSEVVILKDGPFYNPRRAARVVNDADYAAQVEFGIGPGWKGSRRQGGTHGVPNRTLSKAGRKIGTYRGGVS